ncbi:MAG: hypothetical protein A3K67_07275 [Euryarchaeota archaeon RBG_16_62_10]|nr:MAG: hypothetical protein A3K67_07275 [Euryarchaeota archaeon RBG_16_62_10]
MGGLLQVLAGLLIVFFLPGYTLVNLLFPRKGELDPEYDIVYRVALGMGLSVVISIMAGFGLNAISTEEHGYVSAGPLWAVLGSATAMFAFLGWYRGAYPMAGLIHTSLYRAPASRGGPAVKPSDFARHRRTERLLLEREQLLADLKSFTGRASTSNPQRKLYYRRRVDHVRERIDEINDELRKLSSEGR